MSKTGRAGMGAAWMCMVCALAAVLLVMSFATAASAATYYVAKTGNDNNPGTEAQPWLTITKAANTLVAGDTVYVKAGTYAERVVPVNSGAEGAWIKYLPYPGHTVTIDGADVRLKSWTALVDILYARNYIEFSGFRVINSQYFGMRANWHYPQPPTRSSNIVFRNNYVGNSQNSGIVVSASDNCIVDGNEIENSCLSTQQTQEILTIQEGCNGIDVMNNYVHGVGNPRYGGEGIDVKNGSSNVEVHDNIVTGVRMVGIYVDAYALYQANINVYNNLVFNNTTCCAAMSMGVEAGGTLENVHFYNNIVYGNGPCSAMTVGNGEGTSTSEIRNCSIINNTFYNNGSNMWDESYGGIDVGLSVTVGSVHDIVVRNNICSQNVGVQIRVKNAPYVYNITVDHNLIDGFKGVLDEVKGTDYVEGDPGFVNAAGGDFHLLGGSIAINHGSSTSAPAFDYDYNTRPLGGSFDIGAYECDSTPAPPVADFVGNPTSGTAPLNVAFTDTSSGSPTSWSWTFGDGGSSGTQNPSHTYNTANQYTVSLTATNAQGSDTETKTNYITVVQAQDYTCVSLTVNNGTIASGDHTSVHTSDNVYLVITAAKSGNKYTAQVSYTINTGLGSLSSLVVTAEGKVSTGTQPLTVYAYNYSTSTWTSIATGTLTTTDSTVSPTVSNPSQYLSGGTLQVRVKVGGTGSTAFSNSTDLVKITAAP